MLEKSKTFLTHDQFLFYKSLTVKLSSKSDKEVEEDPLDSELDDV